MASTYDYISETSSQYFGTDLPVNALNRAYVIQRTVNIATAMTDLSVSTTFASGDYLYLIDIPVNTWVLAVFLRVTTASTDDNSPTLDVGDVTSVDADEYIADLAADSTGITSSFLTTDASVDTAGGKIYTAADKLAVTFQDADINNGIFTLTAVMLDVS